MKVVIVQSMLQNNDKYFKSGLQKKFVDNT